MSHPLRSWTRRTILAAAITLTALHSHAVDLFPFVLPWDDATPGVTNISGLLDQPAGAKGFVTSRDGHLFAGDKRLRIFGINLAFGGNFPTHDDAEKVAGRLAKFGINCVRFHHMDTALAPVGILQKDRRTLDPEMLDRLDYFVAQLKKNGIYTNLNLHVGNAYPGMPTWEGSANYFKGVDNFYPPMIEQQRDYARALLTHVNNYTGNAYAAESAVALVEINNENGLIMEWNNNAFDRMPDPYAAEFTRQWNVWLTKKYGDQAKLGAAWKQGEEPLGGELLKNGDFTEGFKHWSFEQHEGAKGSALIGDGEGSKNVLKVSVEKPGPENWHLQFTQNGLKIEKGKTHSVRLHARASEPRKISVVLSQAHAPWKVLASGSVRLTTQWQDIEVPLSPNESDDQARIGFSNFGPGGDISFDHISLRPGGIVALGEGEQLGNIPFFRKSEISRRTLEAQKDWNRFLVDTEGAYWPDMARFIKGDLKSKSLVLGSATGFSPWIVQEELDVVDAHSYWQHPHFPRKQWDMNDWTVRNDSMAGAADGGTLPGLALRRVAGKPFIVTEYNHASPNTYSGEAFLEVCAIAALQDWDGVFAFAYSHRKDDWDTKHITSFFDIDQHPTKMATLPAALAMFYRADVHPPGPANVAQVTRETAIESIRLGSSWVDARAYGIQREETFQHPIAMRLGQEDRRASAPKVEGPVIKSDNGELTWDSTGRRLLVATPRSAAVVGNVQSGETIDLGPVKIVPGATLQNWAAITVSAIDGDSVSAAKRILITATGYAENTGMGWKDAEKTTVGSNWGKAPSLVEGITATIAFPAKTKLKAWTLDERGQRQREVPVTMTAGIAKIELTGEQKTLWWEVAAE